jgi:hypothetical protein
VSRCYSAYTAKPPQLSERTKLTFANMVRISEWLYILDFPLIQISRSFLLPQYARGVEKLSSRGSFERCNARELKLFWHRSPSWQILEPNIQQSSKTMSDSCTSRWTNYTWSSLPTANRIFFKTSTPYIFSHKSSQVHARP